MKQQFLNNCSPGLVVGLTLASAFSLAFSSSAQVILSDSFNRGPLGSGDGNGNPAGVTPKSDWGSNDNAFGGSAVQTYTFDQSRGGGAQQTLDGSGVATMYNGAAQIEFDFAPLTSGAGGYTVSFDFKRTTGNGFIALGIGLDDTDLIENTGGFNGNAFLFTNPANGAEAAALFKQNGDIELWAGGAAAAQTIGGFYSSPEDWHSAAVAISAPTGYGGGSGGTLLVSVDGGAAVSQAITFDGISSGYLSLFSNQSGLLLDNLVVVIPEPTSFTLLGIGGICLWFARSRRDR
jgi:hypothetical protein